MKLKLTMAASALFLLIISQVGCALNTMHPGRRLVARKCTACHDEPAPETLRGLDLMTLGQIHEGKQRLDSGQMALVQEYANAEKPGDGNDVQTD